MASIIPDSVGDTLNGLIGLYSQVEAVKLNNSLTKAAASAAAIEAASRSQNVQLAAQIPVNNNKTLLIVGGVGVAILVLFLAVR